MIYNIKNIDTKTYIYFKPTESNVDAVIIIGSTSTMKILPNGNIFGFALINFDEKTNSIYIDVICSHIGIKGRKKRKNKQTKKNKETKKNEKK